MKESLLTALDQSIILVSRGIASKELLIELLKTTREYIDAAPPSKSKE